MAAAYLPPEADAFWDHRSANYERMAGDCTHGVVRRFLTLCPPITSSSVVLDNGCGPGVVTENVMESFPAPATIHAVDKLPAMAELAQRKFAKRGWTNIHTGAMDAADLSPFADNMFTHSFANFVIMFVGDAPGATGHVYRTLRPEGTAILTTWADISWAAVLKKAQLDIRPDLAPAQPPFAEEWYKGEKLRDVVRQGGFAEDKIEIKLVESAMRSDNLDGLVSQLAELFENATEHWTESEKTRWLPSLKAALAESKDLRREIGSDRVAIGMVANVAIAVK